MQPQAGPVVRLGVAGQVAQFEVGQPQVGEIGEGAGGPKHAGARQPRAFLEALEKTGALRRGDRWSAAVSMSRRCTSGTEPPRRVRRTEGRGHRAESHAHFLLSSHCLLLNPQDPAGP
jgi:hypothetical protein